MVHKVHVISPIAIDMGAKNTGIYLNHFEEGEDPTTSHNAVGSTLVIDSNSITWSQEQRTTKRHQVRTSKRRKLAKRLLHLILQQHYGLNLAQGQIAFLNGLLNRRGYTYLVEELDEALVKQPHVANYFCQQFPEIFTEAAAFYRDFLELSNDFEQASQLHEKLTLSKTEAKQAIEEKENKQSFAEAYTNIKEALTKQIKSENEGHKYRAEYLKNIHTDIHNTELLNPIIQKISANDLANLIGNISNLQLRVLRKYFNDEAMKTGDIWKPEKLRVVFFKWIRGWHAKQENEKQNRAQILHLQNSDRAMIEILATLDPKKTIPPYEDQNNRRPPKDKTLRLKPSSLDKQLPDWETLTQSLIQHYCLPPIQENHIEKIDITENLQACTSVQKRQKETQARHILANALHRILDRTSLLDPYKLRWQVNHSTTKDALKAKQRLNKHSQNQADTLIDFAAKYYQEVEMAKQGLWSDNEHTLFYCCDTNPPQKGNIQHKLVGHILREDFTPERLQTFIDECWNVRINRSTMKGLAKKIEDTRKDYGNAFNHIARTIQNRRYVSNHQSVSEQQQTHWQNYEQTHSDVITAIENAELIATTLDEYLKHNKQSKYNNPFSIAQLYNHLETEKTGFSKTDKFNTEENAWRDKEEQLDVLNAQGHPETRTASNGVRLTADSIRPFDGMLARILDRQAYEIATLKIEQIEKANIDPHAELLVPILMEQNRFKFEQDLAEIKANGKKKNDAAQKLEKQQANWQTKTDRIQKNKRCPYNGQIIGKGEIDHIIPRSQSRKQGGVIFNSEANLIYCSGEGNHQKGDQRFHLAQLHPSYLIEIFETDKVASIEQQIRDFVTALNTNDVVSFHTLDATEQNYLRHALFLPELDHHTFPILNTRFKTLVNGTQGYLGKKIRKLLQEKYPNIQVKTYQVDAQDVSQIRTTLGTYDPKYAKQDRQGAHSHVVDAALVLAAALQNEKIAQELKTIHTTELSERGEWLSALMPTGSDVKRINRKSKYRKKLESTQIFKEGIYGERFMPILIFDEKLHYGFTPDNAALIKPNKKHGFSSFEDYFELLKPFLYTGKKNNKTPVVGNLADNSQYDYLTIDKTKALEHLQKCAKQVCTETEMQQAVQLEKLRYSIEKKEIKSVLLKDKKFIEALDDKKFKVASIELPAKADWLRLINHPIKDCFGETTTLKNCFGLSIQVEIDQPEMVNFWQMLSQESGITIETLQHHLFKRTPKGELAAKLAIIPKRVFEQKMKEIDTLQTLKNNARLQSSFGVEFKRQADRIPQQSWQALFKAFFHTDKLKNQHTHKQIRKDYSLPIVSAPSGGFRIKRKNPVTQEPVYQVSGIEGFATKGLDSELQKPAHIDQLMQSENIAALETMHKIEHACYYDEWRSIPVPDELAEQVDLIEFALGSKDRFNIRLSLSMTQLMALAPAITSYTQLPAEIQDQLWKFKKSKLLDSDLLGKPRSNLFLEQVHPHRIVFSYKVDSTTAVMKEAYKKGQPITEAR